MARGLASSRLRGARFQNGEGPSARPSFRGRMAQPGQRMESTPGGARSHRQSDMVQVRERAAEAKEDAADPRRGSAETMAILQKEEAQTQAAQAKAEADAAKAELRALHAQLEAAKAQTAPPQAPQASELAPPPGNLRLTDRLFASVPMQCQPAAAAQPAAARPQAVAEGENEGSMEYLTLTSRGAAGRLSAVAESRSSTIEDDASPRLMTATQSRVTGRATNHVDNFDDPGVTSLNA